MTETGPDKSKNEIDISNGLDEQEIKKLQDAIKKSEIREKMKVALENKIQNADPNLIEDTLNSIAKNLQEKPVSSLSEDEKAIIIAYNELFSGTRLEPLNGVETTTKDESSEKEKQNKAFEKIRNSKLGPFITFIEGIKDPEKQKKVIEGMLQIQINENSTNQGNVNNPKEKEKIINGFISAINTHTIPDETINNIDNIIRDIDTYIDTIISTIKKRNTSNDTIKGFEYFIEKIDEDNSIGLLDDEKSEFLDALEEVLGVEEKEAEKKTADSVLGIEINDLKEIDGEKAYKLGQLLSSIGLPDLINAPHKNKLALITYLSGKTGNTDTLTQAYQVGGKIKEIMVTFKSDSLILDKDELKELRDLISSGTPDKINDFFEKQFTETVSTSELLKTLDEKHPLNGREELVNNMDNAIDIALLGDFPTMPGSIRRNMATAYTISMLDYVSNLSEEKQLKLAKDLEPTGKNVLESIMNTFKKFQVNDDVGKFFTKYDKFNKNIKEKIVKDDMTKEGKLKKYKILGDPAEFVKAFGKDELPDMTKGPVEINPDLKSLTELLKSGDKKGHGIKNLSSNVVDAMDTLARDLNSTGKEIHGVKDMLESGEYTDTIRSLLSIPVLGKLFKSFMDLGMKLLGYENGVDGYLEKMDDKALKETSEFIIDDFKPTDDKGVPRSPVHFTKGIFAGVKAVELEPGSEKIPVHLHKGFSEGMANLGKDFRDTDEVKKFLNGNKLNKFIENFQKLNNVKITPKILDKTREFTSETADGLKEINLSKLATRVQIYGEFTSENNKGKKEGKAPIKLEEFMIANYPAEPKKEEEKEKKEEGKEKKEKALKELTGFETSDKYDEKQALLEKLRKANNIKTIEATITKVETFIKANSTKK